MGEGIDRRVPDRWQRPGDGSVVVPLSQSKFAIIDEVDFGIVKDYIWCALKSDSMVNYEIWYAVTHPKDTNSRGGSLRMHRLLLGAPKGVLVDHADGNGLNNRRNNIRLATGIQNGANKRYRIGIGGYRGIRTDKRSGKWRAVVTYRGERIYGLMRDHKIQAARDYDALALEFFGEFAVLNFPVESILALAEGTQTP